MREMRQSAHGEWSSRWVFIMAATGSAVGLGNIWRFPYVTGENGGGAFVLVYLACVIVVGLPIMMGEILIGRRGRQSPIHALKTLAREEGLSDHWKFLGWLGVVAGFIILSFYTVIAGWSLAYVLAMVSGQFSEITAAESEAHFTALIASPGELIFWHSLFMALCVVVVAKGVEHGLERAVKWLMPALFVLLVVMVGYAMGTGDFQRALGYLFTPDFSKLSGAVILEALGQAFFSLSLGMGAIMAYGAYLPHSASIPSTTTTIAICDTLVALLAGLAIFPVVFQVGLDPGSGPGLIFMTLTVAFGQMPLGVPFGTLFFVLLTVAAWTSAISLMEPVTAWFVEKHEHSRTKAACIAGAAAWFVGIGSALSFNVWADRTLFGKTFQESAEYLSTTIMLPLGGLMIALFVGWQMSRRATAEELAIGTGAGYRIWLLLVRFVAPLGVLLVFLNALGVLD